MLGVNSQTWPKSVEKASFLDSTWMVGHTEVMGARRRQSPQALKNRHITHQPGSEC